MPYMLLYESVVAHVHFYCYIKYTLIGLLVLGDNKGLLIRLVSKVG